MKCTVKHFSRFSVEKGVGGDLNRPQAWDALRSHTGQDDPFAFPADRRQWQDKAMGNEALNRRADDLAKFIHGGGYGAVHSFGVGTAALEFLLKRRLKNVIMHCSDYAPKTVEILRGFFPEAEVGCFDMGKDRFPAAPEHGLCLLHRVDTEFSDGQWRDMFGRMADAGIRDIVFIPHALIGPADILKEAVKGWLRPWVKGMAFAGYVRTKQRLFELWQDHYRLCREIPAGDLRGFVLNLKRKA